jgi:uncharacterized protein YndB with AHSA1/START domain
VESIIHRFDLEPGGTWLNEMKWGDNSHFHKVVFHEIIPHEKLVWHHSASDGQWNIIANPMMPNWPRVLLTTVTFTTTGDTTNVCLTQTPLNATQAELDCFSGAMGGMDNGWGGGFALIDEIVVELRADS